MVKKLIRLDVEVKRAIMSARKVMFIVGETTDAFLLKDDELSDTYWIKKKDLQLGKVVINPVDVKKDATISAYIYFVEDAEKCTDKLIDEKFEYLKFQLANGCSEFLGNAQEKISKLDRSFIY